MENKVAKNFVIAFKGEPGLAARRAEKFFNLCKNGKEWRSLWVETPSKEFSRMYLQPDKSAKQIRKEICTRRLGKVLETHYYHAGLRVNKYKGTASSGWQTCIK
eukprot:3655847-Karenia_brevis.AAC.1